MRLFAYDSLTATETCGSSRKTARHPSPCSSIIDTEELPWDAGRVHPINTSAHNIGARFAHSTTSLVCLILHHDHFLRNRRQDLFDRGVDGNEAPTHGRLLRGVLSIDRNDHPFSCLGPRCTNIDPQALYQLFGFSLVLDIWSKDASRRVRDSSWTRR